MDRWTLEERGFIVTEFLTYNRSFVTAKRNFRKHFKIPHRKPVPSNSNILRWLNNLQETGSVSNRSTARVNPIKHSQQNTFPPDTVYKQEQVSGSLFQFAQVLVKCETEDESENKECLQIECKAKKKDGKSLRQFKKDNVLDRAECTTNSVKLNNIKKESGIEEINGHVSGRYIKKQNEEVHIKQEVAEEDLIKSANWSACPTKNEKLCDIKKELNLEEISNHSTESFTVNLYEDVFVKEEELIGLTDPLSSDYKNEDDNKICTAQTMSPDNACAENQGENIISSKKFMWMNSLAGHKKPHTKEKIYECEYCNKKYRYHENLVDHKKIHTGEKIHECNECKKRFIRGCDLTVHKLIHTGEKPFGCNVCHKSFNRSYNLKLHMRIHTGEKPHQCDICHKRYSHSSHLSAHKIIHKGEKTFKCKYCEEEFTDFKCLVSHRQQKHARRRQHTCDQCDKSFPRRYGLDIHKKTHRCIKIYRCIACNETFSLLSDLKNHRSSHPDLRPYECDYCENMFTTNYHLVCHRRIHTGERPFNCDQCDRSFKRRGDLNGHKKIHTDDRDRPFECEICHKSFYTTAHLNKHSKTHTKNNI